MVHLYRARTMNGFAGLEVALGVSTEWVVTECKGLGIKPLLVL